MVKAKRKPLDQIMDAVRGYKRVLNVGCGGCVSVCLAGGQKEVQILSGELNMHFMMDKVPTRLDSYTVERQCNMQYLEELDDMVAGYDCLLSMACGAGVQLLAERFPNLPVFPAVNTLAIGVDRDLGTVRGALPGLWRMRSRLYRRHLPGDPLLQAALQRPLRRAPGAACVKWPKATSCPAPGIRYTPGSRPRAASTTF